MTTETLTRPRLDRSKVVTRIAELAAIQRALHAGYALPHNSDAFKEAMKAINPCGYRFTRDYYAMELTCLHLALAESRGKAHCLDGKWAGMTDYRAPRMLERARALITEKPAESIE